MLRAGWLAVLVGAVTNYQTAISESVAEPAAAVATMVDGAEVAHVAVQAWSRSAIAFPPSPDTVLMACLPPKMDVLVISLPGATATSFTLALVSVVICIHILRRFLEVVVAISRLGLPGGTAAILVDRAPDALVPVMTIPVFARIAGTILSDALGLMLDAELCMGPDDAEAVGFRSGTTYRRMADHQTALNDPRPIQDFGQACRASVGVAPSGHGVPHSEACTRCLPWPSGAHESHKIGDWPIGNDIKTIMITIHRGFDSGVAF